MDLTSSDTVLPRILPTATSLSPFLYESKGGKRTRANKRNRKTRKNKKRNTRKNKRDSRKK